MIIFSLVKQIFKIIFYYHKPFFTDRDIINALNKLAITPKNIHVIATSNISNNLIAVTGTAVGISIMINK